MGSSSKEGFGFPQLTEPIYENWKSHVKLYLDEAEVSTVLKAGSPAEHDASRAKWDQLDRKAKSLRIGFFTDEYLEVVHEKKTAWLMWKALEETVAKRSVTR